MIADCGSAINIGTDLIALDDCAACARTNIDTNTVVSRDDVAFTGVLPADLCTWSEGGIYADNCVTNIVLPGGVESHDIAAHHGSG